MNEERDDTKGLHPNTDFFVADIWICALKDDYASMEHPFFSLSKKRDLQIYRYQNDRNSITISPNAYGHPTIWDKDILIYCCSQLIAGMRKGREPQQVIRVTAHDLLVSTNRSTSKLGYDRLKAALNRLAGALINTDIETGGERIQEGFGIIDWWRIIEKSPLNKRMVRIEIKLSDWLYRAILSHEVLTLDRDYFRLDGGLERRVYELCRKHCGNQATWSIGLELLHKKSGARSPLRNFRIAVRKLAQSNHLPEYRLKFAADKLTVYSRTHKGGIKEFRDVIGDR
jgi:plasmid replication initiation protein